MYRLQYHIIHCTYIFSIDFIWSLRDVIQTSINDRLHPSVALGKLSQQFLVFVDPSSVHVLELGEEGGHVWVEVVPSESIALLQLEDVGVATLFGCLLLLSQRDCQLRERERGTSVCVCVRAYATVCTLSIFALVELGSLSAFSNVCIAFSASSLAFSYCFFVWRTEAR